MTATLIDNIIEMEWEAFQLVQNEGGRADCQDDAHTFWVMRASQYKLWPQELLESYLGDLTNAKEAGKNLVEQKYAWMMASTAPEEFSAIKDTLPRLSAKKQKIVQDIIMIQFPWMEQFAQTYPHIAAHGRKPAAKTDNPNATSGITYLQGELYTYSEHTLELYLEFVSGLNRSGRNLQTEITEEMMRLKGYHSLNQVEFVLARL